MCSPLKNFWKQEVECDELTEDSDRWKHLVFFSGVGPSSLVRDFQRNYFDANKIDL